MARISGVDLPRNKRVEIALTYIYGIGKATSSRVLEKAKVSPDKRSDDLDENDMRAIRGAIFALPTGTGFLPIRLMFDSPSRCCSPLCRGFPRKLP